MACGGYFCAPTTDIPLNSCNSQNFSFAIAVGSQNAVSLSFLFGGIHWSDKRVGILEVKSCH